MKKVLILITVLFLIFVCACNNKTNKKSQMFTGIESYINPQNFEEALLFSQNAYIATCTDEKEGIGWVYTRPKEKYKLYTFKINEIIYETVENNKNDIKLTVVEPSKDFIKLNNNINPFEETKYEIGKKYLIIGSFRTTPLGYCHEFLDDYSYFLCPFDDDSLPKIVGRSPVLTIDGRNIKKDFSKDELLSFMVDYYSENCPRLTNYCRIDETDVEKIVENSALVFECEIKEKVKSYDCFLAFDEYKIEMKNIVKEPINPVNNEVMKIDFNKEIRVRLSPEILVELGDVFTAGYSSVYESNENKDVLVCNLAFLHLFNFDEIN